MLLWQGSHVQCKSGRLPRKPSFHRFQPSLILKDSRQDWSESPNDRLCSHSLYLLQPSNVLLHSEPCSRVPGRCRIVGRRVDHGSMQLTHLLWPHASHLSYREALLGCRHDDLVDVCCHVEFGVQDDAHGPIECASTSRKPCFAYHGLFHGTSAYVNDTQARCAPFCRARSCAHQNTNSSMLAPTPLP